MIVFDVPTKALVGLAIFGAILLVQRLRG